MYLPFIKHFDNFQLLQWLRRKFTGIFSAPWGGNHTWLIFLYLLVTNITAPSIQDMYCMAGHCQERKLSQVSGKWEIVAKTLLVSAAPPNVNRPVTLYASVYMYRIYSINIYNIMSCSSTCDHTQIKTWWWVATLKKQSKLPHLQWGLDAATGQILLCKQVLDPYTVAINRSQEVSLASSVCSLWWR